MFKFLKFLGALVLVAGVGVGGYFLYDRVLKDKISEWKGEEFQLIYSYETLTGLDSDKTPYGLVKGYQGVAPEEIIVEDSFEDNGTKRAVVAVKSNAFKNARKTKKIEFPASVAIFGYNVFKGCDNLETAIFKMPNARAIVQFEMQRAVIQRNHFFVLLIRLQAAISRLCFVCKLHLLICLS